LRPSEARHGRERSTPDQVQKSTARSLHGDPLSPMPFAEEVAMAQKLDIAFWSYDRTRLLADGSVKIEGADVAFHSARIVPEIFEAMIRRRAYDVSELGMTYFLRTFDEEGHSPFLAIPVFPSARSGTVPSTSVETAASKSRRTLSASGSVNSPFTDTTPGSYLKAFCPTISAETGTEPLGHRRHRFPDWSH
jgi:hypothetical protein